MEDNKIIKFVYSLFLGVLLAIFVGVGVNTFYPGPEWPEYPNELSYAYDKEPTAEQQEAQRQYDERYKAYEAERQEYSQTLTVILLISAVLLLVISVTVERKLRFIADGIMLGGLFTLIYSLTASFASDNSYVRFAATTIGVVVVLVVGYVRFIRPATAKAVKKSKKK